jgi:hypothetical protein
VSLPFVLKITIRSVFFGPFVDSKSRTVQGFPKQVRNFRAGCLFHEITVGKGIDNPFDKLMGVVRGGGAERSDRNDWVEGVETPLRDERESDLGLDGSGRE